jgi:hypothetical protein
MGVGLGLTLAGGLAGLLSDEDEYKMSPEQRALYHKLLKEYESGDFGYSQSEKNAMKESIRQSLLRQLPGGSRIACKDVELVDRGKHLWQPQESERPRIRLMVKVLPILKVSLGMLDYSIRQG